jgi:hypothetical protein
MSSPRASKVRPLRTSLLDCHQKRTTQSIHKVRLCGLNANLQSAITKILNLPGPTRFFLPSTFSELQHTGSAGPMVIVDATQFTSDALVVFFGRDPVHIPSQITKSRVRDMSSKLQSLTLDAKTTDVTRDLAHFLRVLWDEVVSPDFALLTYMVSYCSAFCHCTRLICIGTAKGVFPISTSCLTHSL